MIDEHTVSVSGLAQIPEGHLEHGAVQFAFGARRSIRTHRSPGVLGLHDPVPPGIAAGAAVSVVVGCDKAATTCRERFNNIINFQGFPHMPGNDALAAGAQGPEPRDGGSRFS